MLLSSLVTGCKVYVDRPLEKMSRKAEILATRSKKVLRGEESVLEYYVHFVEFNKVTTMIC